jgi:hypothetical protein
MWLELSYQLCIRSFVTKTLAKKVFTEGTVLTSHGEESGHICNKALSKTTVY